MGGKRYKALRGFWWQPPEGGDVRLAQAGDVISAEAMSEQNVADLLADGLIRETRAKGDD